MKIPFIRFSDIYTNDKIEIDAALSRVFSQGELILGDYGKDITELEKWFASYIGVKHAIMTGSGTQALYCAYKALGIGPGDEVITTAHTFSATFDQIVALGATPILVDIDPETGLIDPNEIQQAITDRTKAIVPVHLEGKVCDMNRISALAKQHNLYVIEDAAQAIGAEYSYEFPDETPYVLKTGNIGDIGCFSLYPAKIFGGLGNVGMLTTNDDELAYKLSNIRANYRFEKDPEKIEYGMNFEPDNAWAAVLNVRRKHLDDYITCRAQIAAMYDDGLKDLPIKLPWKQAGRVWQDFVLRIPENKEAFLAHLKEHGVGFLGHDVPFYPDYPKLKLNFDLPHTKQYILEQVRIPCNPFLTIEEVKYIIQTIRSFYEK